MKFLSSSIPCVSLSGQFIFDLMDTYGGGLGVLWVAIFETFVLMWIYGANRFADDLRFMLNRHTSYVWRVCWLVTPLVLALIFAVACANWTAPTYGDGTYHYSHWAHSVGWFLTLVVALQIPLAALIVLIVFAVRGRPLDAFRPDPSWGPGDRDELENWSAYQYAKQFKCKQHPYGQQGYDNYGMQYQQPYYGYGQQAYHM